MDPKTDIDRRRALRAAGLVGAAFVAGPAMAQLEEEQEGVSPAEDLMREHGVLNRILLVYEEAIRRLKEKRELPPDVVPGAAGIVRRFIEEYHETLEEDHIFPRFEKARKLNDLVAVLRAQHRAGRRVTDAIQRHAAGKTAGERTALASDLAQFIRMYRPHEAREDTVLFPALHALVKAREWDAMGEEFEDKEQELFGKNGFEKMVDDVAGLEKRLGIHDLAQFTPRQG
jgi:hemerythrin-like domain-containing protein